MIGDFGYVWNGLWLDRFAEKYDIKQQFVYSPENKVKSNRFEPMKESYQKWLQSYLYETEHELKVAVTKNREEHFLRSGVHLTLCSSTKSRLRRESSKLAFQTLNST